MEKLGTNLLTDPNGPFKGHYIVALKRSGDWCLYKHKKPGRNPDIGYYVFKMIQGLGREEFPTDPKYYKSKQAAYNNFEKMTGQCADPEPITKLPESWETGLFEYAIIKRQGRHIAYSERYKRSGLIKCYWSNKVEVDRLGNEKKGQFALFHQAKSAALSYVNIGHNEDQRHIIQDKMLKEGEKRLVAQIADIQSQLDYIKAGGKITIITHEGKKSTNL